MGGKKGGNGNAYSECSQYMIVMGLLPLNETLQNSTYKTKANKRKSEIGLWGHQI